MQDSLVKGLWPELLSLPCRPGQESSVGCRESTEYSWLCSAHFVSGTKSNDKLSPDYVPSIFSHIASPRKRKAKDNLRADTRRKGAKKSGQKH